MRVAETHSPWREHNLDGFQTLAVSDRVVWSLSSPLIHETYLQKKKAKIKIASVLSVLDDRKF